MALQNSVSDRVFYRNATGVDPTAWHHYVVTYDGSSDVSGIELYVDSTLKTSPTYTENTLNSSILNSIDLTIGFSLPWTGNGTLDELGVWSKVLSQQEVTDLYNSGNGNAYSEGGGTSGSGTINYISKFTSTTAVGNSSLFDDGTNVGLGTTSPTEKLQVAGTIHSTSGGFKFPDGSTQATAVGSGSIGGGGTTNYIPKLTSSVTLGNSSISDNGGTVSVDGNLTATSSISATGAISAKYQDIAEWVSSMQDVPAGTVVVLSRSRVNTVEPSSSAYDTRIAGVVSAEPGIVLGEGGDDRVKVATVGRVKVHVDATSAPIEIGDLLVTSGKLGAAMKSMPVLINGVALHRPGTVIGRALEPMAQGEGEILVLLSLQ